MVLYWTLDTTNPRHNKPKTGKPLTQQSICLYVYENCRGPWGCSSRRSGWPYPIFNVYPSNICGKEVVLTVSRSAHGGGNQFSKRVSLFWGVKNFPRGCQFSEGIPLFLGDTTFPRGYHFLEGIPPFWGDTTFPRGYHFFRGDTTFPRGYHFFRGDTTFFEGIPLFSRGYQFFEGIPLFLRGYH